MLDRFERLGSALELPVLLAWPVKSPNAANVVAPEEFTSINLSDLTSSIPEPAALIASAILWSTVCGVAAVPIVLHRVWVDVLAGKFFAFHRHCSMQKALFWIDLSNILATGVVQLGN